MLDRSIVCLFLGAFLMFHGQNNRKRSLYIFFEKSATEDNYKRHFKKEVNKKGVQPAFDLYDFSYTAPGNNQFQFSTKQGALRLRVDSFYIKKIKPKSPTWLKSQRDTFWPTWSKKFPYKHLYIVEKVADNIYQVVEVESFIGEDF